MVLRAQSSSCKQFVKYIEFSADFERIKEKQLREKQVRRTVSQKI